MSELVPAKTLKYNPAFLDDDQLVASFAVRSRDLTALLEVVRENSGPSNQHVLVIGPRGSGKTTLVLRVAAELRRDPELSRAVYPLVFSEESYEVHDAASLWLDALFHLARQTGDQRWRDAHAQLRRETDPTRLRTLALAELRDFSEAEGKRLLVVVENFNALIDLQLADDEAWTLRHTLLNEPWLMLLATATSRFDGIERSDQAMFDLFRVYNLEPLAPHECAALWRRLTGAEIDERQGRALEILTGGSPRLLTILSQFAADAPLTHLADDLARLIDDHTDYFRSNIEVLSPQEKRVFAALADLWAPATAQDVAERARMSVNATSAVLTRLERAGVVTASAITPRRNRYQLSERLYNIYYVMRRSGSGAERVRFAVEFIAAYYDAEALVEKLIALADETAETPPTQRPEKIHAFFGIYEKIAASHGGLLLERLPQRFLELPELSEDQRRRLQDDRARIRRDQEWFWTLLVEWWNSHRLLREALVAARERPKLDHYWTALVRAMQGQAPVTPAVQQIASNWHAISRELRKLAPRLRQLCGDALRSEPSWVDIVGGGVFTGFLVENEKLFEQALTTAFNRWPNNPWVQLVRSWFEEILLAERTERFVERAARLVAGHKDSIWLPIAAGFVLDIEDADDAAAAFYSASTLSGRLPEVARAFAEIHEELLFHESVLVMEPQWAGLAILLKPFLWIELFCWLARFTAKRLGRWEDAAKILEVASESFPDNVALQLMRGAVLSHAPERAEDGIAILRRAVEAPPADWQQGVAIGVVLAYPLRRPDEALSVLAESWRAFSATRSLAETVAEQAEAWLEPAVELLPGHRLPEQFVAMLRPSRSALTAALTRLLETPPATRGARQELILVVLALAIRGPREELLARLRSSAAAASIEPLIAGLARSMGEDVQTPHEISEPAKDIAASIHLFAGLYELVRREKTAPERRARGNSRARSRRG